MVPLSLYLDVQFDKLGATFVLIVELDKLGEQRLIMLNPQYLLQETKQQKYTDRVHFLRRHFFEDKAIFIIYPTVICIIITIRI